MVAATQINHEAENAVLSSILATPTSFDEVVDILHASDFSQPANQLIFQAMLSCDSTGRPIDTLTVADELKREKALKKAGGLDRLDALLDTAPSESNIAAHAKMVVECAELRQIMSAGQQMIAEAASPDAVSTDVRQSAEQAVFNLARENADESMLAMRQAVPYFLEDITHQRDKLLLGHSTGLKDLDKITAGLQDSQLIILAARPGLGKTSLALQIACHIAEVSGLPVPFLSYEMSNLELTTRLVASRVGMSAHDMRVDANLAQVQKDLAQAAEKLMDVPLYIDDNPPEDIAGVRSQMRRLARKYELGAVFIDYMQLMSSAKSSRFGNRTEEVSAISRGLKQMARELNVPVIVLSQLSRASEQRNEKRPTLSDLRESGSIEQDANTVVFVYRPTLHDGNADPELAELIIAKQRSGQAGVTVNVRFQDSLTKFSDAPANMQQTYTPPTNTAPNFRYQPAADVPF